METFNPHECAATTHFCEVKWSFAKWAEQNGLCDGDKACGMFLRRVASHCGVRSWKALPIGRLDDICMVAIDAAAELRNELRFEASLML